MCRSSFSCTLQTKQKDNGRSIRSFKFQRLFFLATEHCNNLIVNDFYELLSRINCLEDFFALRFFYCTVYKTTDNAQIDISFKQCHFYLLYSFLDIFFRYSRLSAYSTDNRIKCTCYFLKHGLYPESKARPENQADGFPYSRFCTSRHK